MITSLWLSWRVWNILTYITEFTSYPLVLKVFNNKVMGFILTELWLLSIIVQQDTTIYSLFISANCSTCFRWYLHPSSGAHITVSAVSSITETAKDKIASKCLCYITCYSNWMAFFNTSHSKVQTQYNNTPNLRRLMKTVNTIGAEYINFHVRHVKGRT